MFFNPRSSSAQHSQSLTSIVGWGREMEREKWSIYTLSDKDNFNSKSCAWKDKTSINSSSASHMLADAQSSPGKQGSVTCTNDLGRQTPLIRITPFLLLLPGLRAEHDTIWPGIFLWSVGVSSPAVSLHSSLCIPSLLTDGVGWEVEKNLALWKHCPAVAKSSLNYCFQHESKTQPCVPANVKNINSVLVKTRTHIEHNLSSI